MSKIALIAVSWLITGYIFPSENRYQNSYPCSHIDTLEGPIVLSLIMHKLYNYFLSLWLTIKFGNGELILWAI